MRLKNKMKMKLWYQGQEKQLQDLDSEILIGMKLMVRRTPLFPLIWPLQWEINTDKDFIWYSVSHQLHTDNLVKLEILGMEPAFCSIQHPDLAGFLRWRNQGLGTHPTLTAQNQASSTRVSISATPPWRCHPRASAEQSIPSSIP